MGCGLERASLLTDTAPPSPVGGTSPSPQLWRDVNRAFRSKRLALSAVLGPPVVWMLFVYIGSLLLLVVASLFKLDQTTQKPTTTITGENVADAFTSSNFLGVVARSVGVAAAVTALSFLVALPAAFCIAKVMPKWSRRGLIVAVLMPLWAGYLVKAYAWKTLLAPEGNRFAADGGGGGGFLQSTLGWAPGKGYVAVILSLTYLWLPYMVLPIYAGIERLPDSLLDAAGDLGARPLRTFRSVILPMLVPAVAAGSIFTFSLSLGDYIIPAVVTERKVQMLGNIIERTLLAPNQPLAAAYTLWPLAIIVTYLLFMRRMGAFDNV